MPKFKRHIELNSLEKVELRIYAIGYARQGETILALLCKGKDILLSILTDCFQKQKKGVTYFDALDEIFAGYDEPRIDIFIWTHPDLDHSVGIKNVMEKFDSSKHAYVYIPESLDLKNKYNNCQHANDAFEYLLDTYGENVDMIGVHDGSEDNCIEIPITDLSSNTTIHLDGFFLAPSSSLALQRSYREKNFKTNDLSIVYSLCVNGCNLLFTGDIEGANVHRLFPLHLSNLIFHKIPHHGSIHSSAMSSRLQSLNNSGVLQTVTQKGRTPNKEELNIYAPLGDIWVSSDDTNTSDKYGVVCLRYDLRTMQLKETPHTIGNAHRF